jgi:putative Holliday junction resolvase
MTKILAVDWGWAKLGVAVSDDLGLTAQGLPTILRRSEGQALEEIAAHVAVLQVEAIVVGLPRNMDGSDGPSADAARVFAHALEERFQLPVHLWDERLTTLAAERTLVAAGVRRRTRRGLVDQVAATLILQGFLDRRQAASRREIP